MQIDYRELENSSRYNKIMEVSHEELLYWVSDHIRPDNLPMRIFYLLNLPVLVFIFYKIYFILFVAPLNWFYLASIILISVVAFVIVVIPLHELIHAASFKAMGAKNVSIHAQWNKMLFYAIADKYVLNGKEFAVLALLPFLFINALLTAGIIFLRGELRVISVVFLFLHLTGCIGDFALLGYMYENRKKRILNYDDREKGLSYFYEEISKKVRAED